MNKEKQFRTIFTQSKEKIYRLCLGFMGNKADADDLFQEVLIKVWNNLKSFREESHINTWIYRITTNTALLSLKRMASLNKKQTGILPIEKSYSLESSNSIEKEREIIHLYQAISTLKEVDRIIISLLLEECSYAEIANVTGMNISNIGVKINRIKKILNKRLKQL